MANKDEYINSHSNIAFRIYSSKNFLVFPAKIALGGWVECYLTGLGKFSLHWCHTTIVNNLSNKCDTYFYTGIRKYQGCRGDWILIPIPVPYPQKNPWESPQYPHIHRIPKFSIATPAHPTHCVFLFDAYIIFALSCQNNKHRFTVRVPSNRYLMALHVAQPST